MKTHRQKAVSDIIWTYLISLSIVEPHSTASCLKVLDLQRVSQFLKYKFADFGEKTTRSGNFYTADRKTMNTSR